MVMAAAIAPPSQIRHCSHAVQGNVDDQSVLVATYEGEHNHPQPSQMEATSGSVPCSASLSSCSPPAVVTLDLTKSKVVP
ncbi:hypothetical protein SESBI_03839 [Sesbania bispinosa]|nr:hypothetical protein SESBI_03839 [Sesbania bispinosa]